jgi:hypothetical protein
VRAGQTLLQENFDSSIFPIDDFKLLLDKIQFHITAREGLTHDSRCRQMLEESKDEIEQLKMPFCTIIKKSWTVWF